jgi:endonuclease/exonuclease/phosphatase family metal-dependent hydrolase
MRCLALACLVLLAAGCMPAPLRVMSFNIRYANPDDGPDAWEPRRPLTLRVIREYDPDVLGLQEVLAGQAEDLLAGLEGYDFVGVGRDDGHLRGEMVPILYRRNRFQLVAGGHIWLSSEPERPGSIGWDAACPRMATWVRLRFLDSPLNEVVVVNTHLDHRGRAARRESAQLLRRLTDSLSGSPLILMGDFNCGPDSSPYFTLTRAAGNLAELTDAHAGDPRLAGQGTYHGFRGRAEGARIDWILHNRRFETVSAEIIQTHEWPRQPSDHFPVTATLRLLPVTKWSGQ